MKTALVLAVRTQISTKTLLSRWATARRASSRGTHRSHMIKSRYRVRDRVRDITALTNKTKDFKNHTTHNLIAGETRSLMVIIPMLKTIFSISQQSTLRVMQITVQVEICTKIKATAIELRVSEHPKMIMNNRRFIQKWSRCPKWSSKYLQLTKFSQQLSHRVCTSKGCRAISNTCFKSLVCK
jgi:hypothetical protein